VNSIKAKLITRVNYTDRNYTANTRKTKLIQGLSHSHKFKAGNKIRIVITNLDTAPDDVPFLATNPHALPVMVNGVNQVFLNSNSYLNFPVTSGGFTSTSNTGTGVPENFSLSQNFPNPFNPVTSIKFDLPKSSAVKLIIYDAIGREVETVLNDRLNEGSYRVEWDANKYSSGVYIYRFITDEFNAAKYMILVK
jgi:hypothetical protein